MIELQRQKQLKESFDNFYTRRLKPVIDDSRDRYNMVLKDKAEREARQLSALPSTKSTSIVDGYVENALFEYSNSPDAISFTARNSYDQVAVDMAQLLTQNFIYRADNTADFLLWHEMSLRAGAVDGIECAMASWVKESYLEDQPGFAFIDESGQPNPVDEQTFFQNAPFDPRFIPYNWQKERVTRDTWQVDQLMLGRDVFYDPSVRLLNVNRGQFAGVILQKTVADILNYSKQGIFNAEITEESLKKHQKTGYDDITTLLGEFSDGKDTDLQDKNLIPLCIFFYKQDNKWLCQFSLDWNEVISEWVSVNQLFFNGRKVDRLPIVIGYTHSALWEAIGVSQPAKIAPIEDELSDHRNNANDIAKAIAQGGRIRINPDSDVNLDQVINGRAFYADQGDVEFVQYNPGMIEAMRMDDSRTQDIAALVPVSSSDRARQLAGKGTTRTLGMSQMLEQDSTAKMNIMLTIRNATFLKPLLWLIAELTKAFETSEHVMRVAGERSGVQVPMETDMQGNQTVIFDALDIDIDVQINAGLGSMPRYKTAEMITQLSAYATQNQVAGFDPNICFGMLSSVAGFKKDTFINPKLLNPQPPQPQVDYKATIAIDLVQLPPQSQQQLLNLLMAGGMSVTANIDGANPQLQDAQKQAESQMKEAMQNGGGMMTTDRTGQMVDGMGQEALEMSQGGMMNGQ